MNMSIREAGSRGPDASGVLRAVAAVSLVSTAVVIALASAPEAPAGTRARVFAALAVMTSTGGTAVEEAWYETSIAGCRVGVVHMTVESASDTLLVTTITSDIVVERLGERAEMRQRDVWTETVGGRALSYSSRRMLSAGETTTLEVGVEPGALTLRKETKHGGDSRVAEIGGRLMFTRALAREDVERGFVPGVTYKYPSFDPDFETVSRCSVAVVGRETLQVAGRREVLNAIELWPDVYEGLELHEWRDDAGSLWVQEITALGVETRRVTADEARRELPPPDVITGLMVETDVTMARPGRVDEALYEIWLDGGDVAALVAGDLRQSVDGRTDRGLLLRVRRTVPGAKTLSGRVTSDELATDGELTADGTPARDPELSEFLEGNVLLQKDDPDVLAAALEAVAGAGSDPWSMAVSIEGRVAELITDRGFGTAFASAAEVIDTRNGDCSEHAVLAAAMARAVGIPSRLATGVVHFRGGFAYHMWMEVRVGDGWFALDPTIGDGSVDATHIRLGGGSLAGGRVSELSVPVLRTANRLGIRIVEYEEAGRTVRPE